MVFRDSPEAKAALARFIIRDHVPPDTALRMSLKNVTAVDVEDEVAAFVDVDFLGYLPSPMWVAIDPSVVKREVTEISALYAAYVKSTQRQVKPGVMPKMPMLPKVFRSQLGDLDRGKLFTPTGKSSAPYIVHRSEDYETYEKDPTLLCDSGV